jgi:hypothetical protein
MTPLTEDQKVQVRVSIEIDPLLPYFHISRSAFVDPIFQLKKAKREAKRAFQPRQIALGNGSFRIGEPGEIGGSRYCIFRTTTQDLSVFGLHICGYFLHLKGLILICLFVTCTNLPSVLYFQSSEYASPDGGWFWFQGSAVCDGIEGVDMDGLNRTVETIRNPCPFTKSLGLFGLLSVGGFAFFFIVFRYVLNREMVRMDESSQTAQDYSVVVKDPDPDARDPDEWFTFFSQFGEVVSITVALKNGLLLNDLARQRYVRLMIDYEAVHGTDPFHEFAADNIAQPAWMKKELNNVNANKVLDFAGFGLTPEQWLKEFRANRAKLSERYKLDNDVCQVFCIFESEAAQRHCLRELTAGLLPSIFDIQTVKDEYLFRGRNQLMIAEAPEPYDVFWENLGMATSTQVVQQKLVCFFYLGCLNTACAMLVKYSFLNFPTFATTVLISCIDEYVPALIRVTVDSTEVHDRYSGRQWSIMTQMFLFLVVNSAIVIYMITPVNETLSPANIQQIAEIIIFNTFFGPLLRYVQLDVRIKQRCHAPFSPNFIKQKSFFCAEQADVGEVSWLQVYLLSLDSYLIQFLTRVCHSAQPDLIYHSTSRR